MNSQVSNQSTNANPIWRQVFPAFVFLAGLAFAAWYVVSQSDSAAPAIPGGVSQASYDSAAEKFKENFGTQPDHWDVVMLAGELAVAQDDLETAKSAFESIPVDHAAYGASALYQHAQVCMRLDLAKESEDSLREYISLAQNNGGVSDVQFLDAIQRLTYLLTIELRWDERRKILRRLHEANQNSISDSIQLFFPSLLIWNSVNGSGPIRRYLQKDKDSTVLRLAHAKYLLGEGEIEEAIVRFQVLHAEGVDAAAVGLLSCYFELADWERFELTLSELPDFEEAESLQLTVLRVRHAQHNANWERCRELAAHVLTVDPTNSVSHVAMGVALVKLGEPESAKQIRDRSTVISKIRVHLSGAIRTPQQIETLIAYCDEIELEAASRAFRIHAQLMEALP